MHIIGRTICRHWSHGKWNVLWKRQIWIWMNWVHAAAKILVAWLYLAFILSRCLYGRWRRRCRGRQRYWISKRKRTCAVKSECTCAMAEIKGEKIEQVQRWWRRYPSKSRWSLCSDWSTFVHMSVNSTRVLRRDLFLLGADCTHVAIDKKNRICEIKK